MVTFEKTIKVSNERIIKYYISDGLSTRYSIEEYFIKDDEMHKDYRLSIDDHYHFIGWINANLPAKEEMETLSYDFEPSHPLYAPLNHLLREESQLIIDDDHTIGDNKKVLLVSRDEDRITLDFINHLEKDDVQNKFSIFSRGIISDPKTKANFETKERLLLFFKEAINQMYQISIEEYLLKEKGIEDEDAKIFMKTMMPKNVEKRQ